MNNLIIEQQRQQFRDAGFFVFARVVPLEHLAVMRATCGVFITKFAAEMDTTGVTQQGSNIKDRGYFIAARKRPVDIPTGLLKSAARGLLAEAVGGEDFLHADFVEPSVNRQAIVVREGDFTLDQRLRVTEELEVH